MMPGLTFAVARRGRRWYCFGCLWLVMLRLVLESSGREYQSWDAVASVKGLLVCREAFVVVCAFAIGPAVQSKPDHMVLQLCVVALDQAM